MPRRSAVEDPAGGAVRPAGAARLSSAVDLGTLLGAVEAAPPVAAADVVGAVLRDALGAEEVSFLIADYSGDHLIRLGHSKRGGAGRRAKRETGDRVPLSGTPHGEALQAQSPEILGDGEGAWILAPVTNRGEAIGLLELRVPLRPSDEEVRTVVDVAHALAYVVIANRRYTDLFDWGQRSVPLTLAAEIQHRLLPGSYTCEGGQFTLAAWLEPAGEIGGDTFDFSLERDALHLSLTDAMGHHVNAALLATLLVGATRNARRAGASLPIQAERGNAAVRDFAGDSQFVTGQLVRIDLASGRAEIVNAGHHPPLRLRDGVVEEVPLEPELPFGLSDGSYRAQPLSLRAGDRLLFLTDGVLERRAALVDVRAILLESADEHPREAVQLLIRAAVEASGGRLDDDATALCLDWHGGPPRPRDAAAGADVDL